MRRSRFRLLTTSVAVALVLVNVYIFYVIESPYDILPEGWRPHERPTPENPEPLGEPDEVYEIEESDPVPEEEEKGG